MIYTVDAIKLFMPYITKAYKIPYTEDVLGIYFSVNGSSDVVGVRYKFSNTDYFKTIEAGIRDKGFDIIDDTFESIIVIVDRDDILKESITRYINGEFSKIHMNIFKAFMENLRGCSVEEIKSDTIVAVCSKSRELRVKIEESLGVNLPEGAELGSLPNPDDFTFNFEF